MSLRELYSIREWAPLTNIIDRIPARIQRGLAGLFPADLNITCVDAVPEFLALGSDAGIVFWYNRYTGDVQKLKAESAAPISCVKIVDSVEFMVAAGNTCGHVSVFQIQKQLPIDLNLVAPCTRQKPIQRYTIRDLHRCRISCCEWSKNGMKLFSGDRQGIVVLTEFDYQTQRSKSVEILSEAYEIVQLSLQRSYLLVSTLYRSIVCKQHSTTAQWHITQVGKKDRKQLMDCGGTFFKRDNANHLLICGRPGLRFWMSDVEGNVEKTLLFKDAVTRSPIWQIPILNPKPKHQHQQLFTSSESNVDTKNFRNLYLYDGLDSLLVTHDETNLYILNLERLSVEAVANGFRNIIDFCVCGKEIFVLEGVRSLIRLSSHPEKPNKTAKIIFNPMMPPPVPVLGANICGTFEAAVEYEPENNIISAEECFESPPEEISSNIPIELAMESPRAAQNRRLEIFNQISKMDFDQSILHHSDGVICNERKKRKSREELVSGTGQGIIEIGQAVTSKESHNSEGDANENLKPKSLELTTMSESMECSFCNETGPANIKEAYAHHLPDLLSPNTLQKTIEEKAKSLAREMDLPEVYLTAITDDELRAALVQKQSQSMLQSGQPFGIDSSDTEISPRNSQALQFRVEPEPSSISKSKPKAMRVEDAGVQTTPCKKVYYDPDVVGYYSSGQPVDDLCHDLRAAVIAGDVISTTIQSTNVEPQSDRNVGETIQQLHFEPLSDEVDGFQTNLQRTDNGAKSPRASTDSNVSNINEWEFLDN